MKKLLMLSLMLLSFGIVFTSCSDDDDDVWNDVKVNHFVYEGKSYDIKAAYEWYEGLDSSGNMAESEISLGNESYYIYLSLYYSRDSKKLIAGTYSFADYDNRKEKTFKGGIASSTNDDEYKFISGTVTVTGGNGSYEIKVEVETELGETVKVYYKGKPTYEEYED